MVIVTVGWKSLGGFRRGGLDFFFFFRLVLGAFGLSIISMIYIHSFISFRRIDLT